MPLYRYALHGTMKTFRPNPTDDTTLHPTRYSIPQGAEVLISTAVIKTYDRRPQIALKIIDPDEPLPIDDLYLLAEDISPEVCERALPAARSFLCAIRRAATDAERASATAQFNATIAQIGEMLRPEVVPIADDDYSEVPPGHSTDEAQEQFALFPA